MNCEIKRINNMVIFLSSILAVALLTWLSISFANLNDFRIVWFDFLVLIAFLFFTRLIVASFGIMRNKNYTYHVRALKKEELDLDEKIFYLFVLKAFIVFVLYGFPAIFHSLQMYLNIQLNESESFRFVFQQFFPNGIKDIEFSRAVSSISIGIIACFIIKYRYLHIYTTKFICVVCFEQKQKLKQQKD